MRTIPLLGLILLTAACVTTGGSPAKTKKTKSVARLTDTTDSVMAKFADDLAKQMADRAKNRRPDGPVSAHLCQAKGTPMPDAETFADRLERSLAGQMGIKIRRVTEMPDDGWFLKCVSRFMTQASGGQEMRAVRVELQLYAPSREITAAAGGEKRWRE